MEARISPVSIINKMKLCSIQTVDKISELPDPILHKILSHLDMRDVVQTSVLSKRWESLWTSLSNLNFDSSDFSSGFLVFVDQVLLLRDGSNLGRLNFTIDDHVPDLENRFMSWILYAVRRNVEELSLNIRADNITDLLPNSLFTCKSLASLKLDMGMLECSYIDLPDSICLPKLKTLNLCSFLFLDEDPLNNLLSSCPLLESLELNDCRLSVTNLIISLPKLKYLKLDIWHSGPIKLCTPNLTRFICEDYISNKIFVENLPSLLEAYIGTNYEDQELLIPAETKKLYAQHLLPFLRALHNVKDLTLTALFIEVISGALDLLYSCQIQLGNLRYLELGVCFSRDCVHVLTYLLKISPNIETLTVKLTKLRSTTCPYSYLDEIKIHSRNVGGYWADGFSSECLLYHLKYVKIEGVYGSVNELKFLEVLLKNSMALEKLEIFTSSTNTKYCTSDTYKRMIKFNEKLLSFPRASRNGEILFFSL